MDGYDASIQVDLLYRHLPSVLGRSEPKRTTFSFTIRSVSAYMLCLPCHYKDYCLDLPET